MSDTLLTQRLRLRLRLDFFTSTTGTHHLRICYLYSETKVWLGVIKSLFSGYIAGRKRLFFGIWRFFHSLFFLIARRSKGQY